MSIFGITKKKAIAKFQKACQSGDFSQAIPAYKELITKTPDDYELFNDLGVMYLETKHLKESEECLRKAVELSENAVHLNNLGRVYLAQGNHPQAMDVFQKAHELDPTDPQPWYNISVCYLAQDRKEDAFNELKQFLESFPKHANGHINLGILLDDMGDKESALKCYEESIYLDPNNWIGRANIIKLLCDLNRFPDSKPHLEAFAATGVNVRVNASDGKVQIFFDKDLFHECNIISEPK